MIKKRFTIFGLSLFVSFLYASSCTNKDFIVSENIIEQEAQIINIEKPV